MGTTKWKSQVTGIVIARVRRWFCLKRRGKNVFLFLQSRTGFRMGFLDRAAIHFGWNWVPFQQQPGISVYHFVVWSLKTFFLSPAKSSAFCRHQKLQKRVTNNQNGSLGRPQWHDAWIAFGNKGCTFCGGWCCLTQSKQIMNQTYVIMFVKKSCRERSHSRYTCVGYLYFVIFWVRQTNDIWLLDVVGLFWCLSMPLQTTMSRGRIRLEENHKYRSQHDGNQATTRAWGLKRFQVRLKCGCFCLGLTSRTIFASIPWNWSGEFEIVAIVLESMCDRQSVYYLRLFAHELCLIHRRAAGITGGFRQFSPQSATWYVWLQSFSTSMQTWSQMITANLVLRTHQNAYIPFAILSVVLLMALHAFNIDLS